MIKLSARTFLIILVELYRRFGRRIVNRRCIYTESCSTFALKVLRSNGALVTDLNTIYQRVSGCGISIIHHQDHRQFVVLNLHGSVIEREEIRPDIIERYKRSN
jgi:putative component of membrane protein insertase Oxa1/YidC/SpoIIIJ protein YidD